MKHFIEIRKDIWETNFDIYEEHLLESLRASIEEDDDEESLKWASEYDYDYTWGNYYMDKYGGDMSRSGSFLRAGKIFFNLCGRPSVEIDELVIGDDDLGEQFELESGWFRFSTGRTIYKILEYIEKDLCSDIPVYFDAKEKHSKDGWVLLELDL